MNPTPRISVENILTLFDFYQVTRKAYHTSGRPENDAEHSWSASYLFLILQPHLEEEFGKLDTAKILSLLCIHDLGELIIGDQPTWSKTNSHAKQEIEIARHELQVKMNRPELFNLYMELESDQPSIEVQIVKSLDRLMPVLMRVHTKIGWYDVEDKVFATRSKLDERSLHRHKFSKTILDLYSDVTDFADNQGYFPKQ
jgi:putative hydrolases of HD superfamily